MRSKPGLGQGVMGLYEFSTVSKYLFQVPKVDFDEGAA
jgi:hypothetical protein